MYFTVEDDISDIQDRHEQEIEDEEQNNSEKLFNEGLNSDVLPSEKRRNQNREPLTF